MTQQFAGKPIIDESLTDDTKGNGVTMKVDGKVVLRPSSLNIHCPFSYAQSAILGKISKPSGASAGGTAYHYALELAYSHKIATGTNPTVNDITQIGVANWEYAKEHNEYHYSKKDSASKMKDDIAVGLSAYVNNTLPKVVPVATEIRWSMGLPKPSSVYSQISGSIDLLTSVLTTKPKLGGGVEHVQGIEVVDHKFTSKKSTEAKYRLQAGVYAMMGQANGHNVVGSVLHNMVRSEQLKTKTNPTQLQLVRPTYNTTSTTNGIIGRATELIDRAEVHHFLTTEKGIDPEDSVKVLYATTTPEVSFLCQELWCGWWHECPMNNPANLPKIDLITMLKAMK